MAELRIPEPSEKQCLFMTDRHKYIGYGGARGGGKSWAVRVKAVLLCLRYAGIKVMIISDVLCGADGDALPQRAAPAGRSRPNNGEGREP